MHGSDQMDQAASRMKELQPRIPSWARLERMEKSIPLAELWKYSDESGGNRAGRLFSLLKDGFLRLCLRITGHFRG